MLDYDMNLKYIQFYVEKLSQIDLNHQHCIYGPSKYTSANMLVWFLCGKHHF